MKVNINLGIIEGNAKRTLECYIDSRLLRQRKNYDEYYVDVHSTIDTDWRLGDLMILAEHFKVVVEPGSIEIEDH